MTNRRGRSFDCLFESPNGSRTAFVRAGDPAAAEDTFRELLVDSGIRIRGTIIVRELGGRIVREIRFGPGLGLR